MKRPPLFETMSRARRKANTVEARRALEKVLRSRYFVQGETVRGEPRIYFVSRTDLHYASPDVTTDRRQANRWCIKMNAGTMAERERNSIEFGFIAERRPTPIKIIAAPRMEGQGSTTVKDWERAFKAAREGHNVFQCPECKGYQTHKRGCHNAKKYPFIGNPPAMRFPAIKTVLSFPGDPDLELKPARPPKSGVEGAVRLGRLYGGGMKANLDFETRSSEPLHDKPVLAYKPHPGAQTEFFGAAHNARIKPGIFIAGSIMKANEYADGRPRPWQYQVADYEVRQGLSPRADEQWGIYLRTYNVRVATFAPGSEALRDALDRMFTAAHALKQSAVKTFKAKRAVRDAEDDQREAAKMGGKGWHTCDCGQWVNDKLAPCSVCKPKSKIVKVRGRPHWRAAKEFRRKK